MIGEHEIAGGFHSFWSELLPLLTPSCVTVFNRTRGGYLEGYRPVDRELGITGAEVTWPDLYAEVAFEIFRLSHIRNESFRATVETEGLLVQAWAAAEASISRHRKVVPQSPPCPGELVYTYLLALGRRYDALRGLYNFAEAEFSPKVSGCGVLGVCEADLSIGRTLVEVKTVDRNFNSKDVRQVIIYLALDHLSGSRRWEDALLFNPRRSFHLHFNPGEFIQYVSAGKRAAHVYQDLGAFLEHRDFLFEHRF